jgi:Xaa-Pro aminopeptidase
MRRAVCKTVYTSGLRLHNAMQDSFTQDFFAGNRQRLRQLFTGTAPIVLTANGQLQRNGDNGYRFRQDSNFWYLTGIEHPDIVLVMDKDKEYLIVPERDVIREAFDGSIDPEELKRRSGVADIYIDKIGWKKLGRKLKGSRHVAVLAPAATYIEWYGLYSNPARAALDAKLKSYNSELELLDLRDHLMQMRLIKQPAELEALQKAIDVTIAGLQYVTDRKRLASYAYEYEVEADLTAQFRRRGCGHAFDPIVAGGARACQLHNTDNIGSLASDELLLFDVGAEYSLYAADISRTVALGEPTRRQETVFEAVCAVQDHAYTLLKPGVINKDYEKQMEMFMGEKLRELGVIKTISKDSVRKYFPHMTSHFLGLDAHDVGDYSKPMRPGMVLVCEPGIYLPEEGIGVRMEDCLVITETGCKVLSSAMPRALA